MATGVKFPKPSQKRKKRNHVRRNATRSRARMIRDLDAIARQEVFERDVYCQRCGSGNNLQWSHVHSRRHYCLRWDALNSKVLCAACHCWWTYNPGLAYDWFSKTWPERWRLLNKVLLVNPKTDVRELWEARCGN